LERKIHEFPELVLRGLAIHVPEHSAQVPDVHRPYLRADLLPGVAYQPASRLHALLILLEQSELGQGDAHLFPRPQLERYVIEVRRRPPADTGARSHRFR